MKTLVLIPGYAFKSSIWDGVAQELLGKYKVLKLNIAEHDLSVLYEFLASKIPKDSIICGWSLGGLIATKFCVLFPDKCSHLMTIASSPDFSAVIDINLFQQLQFLLDVDIDKFLSKFLYTSLYPNSSISNIKYFREFLVQNHSQLKAYLDYLVTTNVWEEYKNIGLRSLHILGSRDAIVSREAFHQWRVNTGADIQIEDDWGHNPFFYNLKFSKIIDRWITENS